MLGALAVVVVVQQLLERAQLVEGLLLEEELAGPLQVVALWEGQQEQRLEKEEGREEELLAGQGELGPAGVQLAFPSPLGEVAEV